MAIDDGEITLDMYRQVKCAYYRTAIEMESYCPGGAFNRQPAENGEPDDSADDDSGGGDDGDGNKPDGQCPAHPRCNQEDADDSEESNDETGPSTTEGSPAPTTTTAPLADYCTEWSSFELPQHDSPRDVPIDVKCVF